MHVLSSSLKLSYNSCLRSHPVASAARSSSTTVREWVDTVTFMLGRKHASHTNKYRVKDVCSSCRCTHALLTRSAGACLSRDVHGIRTPCHLCAIRADSSLFITSCHVTRCGEGLRPDASLLLDLTAFECRRSTPSRLTREEHKQTERNTIFWSHFVSMA